MPSPPKNVPGAPLTKRQQDVYDAIRSHYLAHGYPPTIRQIAAAIGLPNSGPNAVMCHVRPLVAKGKLRRFDMRRGGGRSDSAGSTYVPAEVELSVARAGETVRVSMTGPAVEMTAAEWRAWLERQMKEVAA